MKKAVTFLAMMMLVAMLMPTLSTTYATELEIQGKLTLSPDSGYTVTPVEYALADASEESATEGSGDVLYNMDMIDVENVCEEGEDVYIAVLDTGLMYNWMDYLPVGNIRTEWGVGFSYHTCYWDETYQDFFLDDFWPDRGFITEFGQPWETYGAPYGDGHGTHVTSIITGFNFLPWNRWMRGVAPKAQIIPVLVLDTWIGFVPPGQSIPPGYYLVGGGSYQMVASGIRYTADLAESEGIKIIISMSLGGPQPSPLVEDAIDYAIEKGCIVVVAAGNEGLDGMDYPGAYPQVISAASGGWTMENIGSGSYPPDVPPRWYTSDVPEDFWTEDANGNEFQLFLNDFSGRPNPDLGQRRSHLDVCCPGSWILGPYGPIGAFYSFGWYYVGGTSQATPHVSGIAALVLEKYPDFNQLQMEMALKLAGLAHRMTKLWERERSAIVYAYQGGGVYDFEEFTWGTGDYGTGFLQADAALVSACLINRISDWMSRFRDD